MNREAYIPNKIESDCYTEDDIKNKVSLSGFYKSYQTEKINYKILSFWKLKMEFH